MIKSEAAVHLSDIDTVFKPAKNINDFALGQLLRIATSKTLRRWGENVNAALAAYENDGIEGKVVFSPHSRTTTVPHYTLHGQK